MQCDLPREPERDTGAATLQNLKVEAEAEVEVEVQWSKEEKSRQPQSPEAVQIGRDGV
jgi:hypothetical protein